MTHPAALGFLAIALSALSGAVQAQVAYTAKTVHLRAGPGREYPVVVTLPAGWQVAVQGCLTDYTWCDVVAGPNRGWVYAGNINYNYQNQYVPLLNYGTVIGIGVLPFIIDDYWGRHYYNRPWYPERHRWADSERHRWGDRGRPPPTRIHPQPPPPRSYAPGYGSGSGYVPPGPAPHSPDANRRPRQPAVPIGPRQPGAAIGPSQQPGAAPPAVRAPGRPPAAAPRAPAQRRRRLEFCAIRPRRVGRPTTSRPKAPTETGRRRRPITHDAGCSRPRTVKSRPPPRPRRCLHPDERPRRRFLFRARRQAAHQLPQVLGGPLRHGPIPADEPRRDGSARLGQLRHHHRHRRRLRGPPELRHGGDRPHAGGAGLSRRHHRAARLAKRRPVQGAGQAEPVLRRHGRQHGFDDQPLHGGPQDPQRRRLHAGRRRRQAARPRRHRLQPALPRGVQGRAHRAGRHRGQPAPHRALRLLVRQGAPLDPGRCQVRHPAVRQRRARHRRDRAPAGRERAGAMRSPTCAAPPSSSAPRPKAGSRSTRPTVDQPGRVEDHINPYQTTSEQAAAQGTTCAKEEGTGLPAAEASDPDR